MTVIFLALPTWRQAMVDTCHEASWFCSPFVPWVYSEDEHRCWDMYELCLYVLASIPYSCLFCTLVESSLLTMDWLTHAWRYLMFVYVWNVVMTNSCRTCSSWRGNSIYSRHFGENDGGSNCSKNGLSVRPPYWVLFFLYSSWQQICGGEIACSTLW